MVGRESSERGDCCIAGLAACKLKYLRPLAAHHRRPGQDRLERLEVQHAPEALHGGQQHRQVVLASGGSL